MYIFGSSIPRSFSAVDLLNPGNHFLMVVFQKQGQREHAIYSDIALFEMTIDDRKGVINVHVDSGPKLPDVNGEVQSTSLEYCGADYKLWYLNKVGMRTKICCISFEGQRQGEEHHSQGKYNCRGFVSGIGTNSKVESAEWLVESLEDRIAEILPKTMQEKYLLEIIGESLHGILVEKKKNTCIAMRMIDELLLCGNFSGTAMLAALNTVSTNLKIDEIGEMEKDDIGKYVKSWICASDSGCPDEISGQINKVHTLIKAYIDALCTVSEPMAIQVLQKHMAESTPGVVILRGDCAVSVVRSSTKVEQLKYALSPVEEEASIAYRFLKFTKAFMGPSISSMLSYGLLDGANLHTELLPAVIDIIAGKKRSKLPTSCTKTEEQEYRKLIRSLPTMSALFQNEIDVQAMANMFLTYPKCMDVVTGIPKINIPERASKTLLSSTFSDLAYCVVRTNLDMLLNVSICLNYFKEIEMLPTDMLDVCKMINDRIELSAVVYWSAFNGNLIARESDRASLKVDSLSIPLHMSANEQAPKRSRVSKEERSPSIIDILGWTIDASIDNKLNEAFSMSLADQISYILGLGDKLAKMEPKEALEILGQVALAILNQKYMNGAELAYSMISFLSENVIGNDAFLKCILAYGTVSIASRADRVAKRQKEDESVSLFQQVSNSFVKDPNVLMEIIEVLPYFQGMPSSIDCTNLTPALFFESLSEVYERFDCIWGASRLCKLAARLVDEDPGANEEYAMKSSRLWAQVYRFCEVAQKPEEGYSAILAIQEPKRQIDCIRRLVDYLCRTNDIRILCSLPWAQKDDELGYNMLDFVCTVLWEKAYQEPIDESVGYTHLFDFFLSRGDFQSAALASFSRARRIARESEKSLLDISLDLQKCLILSMTALKCLDSKDAWIEDPDEINKIHEERVRCTDDGTPVNISFSTPNIVDVKDVEREYAISKAIMQIALHVPGYQRDFPSIEEIFFQLLSLNLMLPAWSFASEVYDGPRLQKARIDVVKKLAKHLAKAKTSDMSYPSSIELSLQNNWKVLKKIILETERISIPCGSQLRLTAIESIISSDGSLNPPQWLLKPYLLNHHTRNRRGTLHADSSGLIRVLLQHGRVQLAAEAAMATLKPVLRSVPSVAMPKPACICLPHHLLDTILEELKGKSDQSTSMLLLYEDLSTAVKKVRESSSDQTGIIQEIYNRA